jgi:hypothetical protein
MRSLTSGVLLLLLLLTPRAGLAGKKDEPYFNDELNPNAVTVVGGGQIEINRYRNGFIIGGGYARWLQGILWLDLGTTVVIHRNTNFALDGGIRLKWALKSKVRPYIRALLEFAVLAEPTTEYVIGARVGGGATYYSSPGFGAFLESTISLGPSFGGESAVASSLELMLGIEFPF